MKSKVSRRVSEILPHSHEEEVIQRSETPETPDEDKVLMTRVMFKNIMAKSLEDRKNLADVFVYISSFAHTIWHFKTNVDS